MYLWFWVAAFITGILWYYFRIVRPYAKFPSRRCEHHILLRMLTRKDPHEFLLDYAINCSNQYEREGMCIMWIGIPHLIVYNEDIVKAIMKDPTAVDKPMYYKLFDFLLGKVIISSNGSEFRRLKKMIQPAFHSSLLRSQTQSVNRKAGDMVDQLSSLEGQPTDHLIDILFKCMIHIATDSVFGAQERSLDIDEIHEMVQATGKFMVHRFWSPWLIPDLSLHVFPYGRRMLSLRQKIKDVLNLNVKNVKEKLLTLQISRGKLKPETDSQLSSDPKLDSMADVLVEEHMKDSSISEEDVMNQLFFLVCASFETTSWTLMWCLFLLGHHPCVQERAFAEIQDKISGDVQFEDIDKQEYLESVIKESLRLYPTVPFFARQLKNNLQCGTYEIPRNTMVIFFPYKLHRNPDIFPDPESFKPERFMENDSKIRSKNFIPFAEGNRPCLGKNFALIMVKIVLVHVIRKFKITSLDRKEHLQLTWCFALESVKNLRMQFIPRSC